MKKIINITLMVALAFALSGASALANTESVTTGLTQVQAGGAAPIVKAKWEMLPTKQGGNYKGEDDSTEAGAQIMPTGVKDQNRTIAICAIVTDSDGMGDVNGVYADVFYPTDPISVPTPGAPIDLGDHHVFLSNQSEAVQGPYNGCAQFMQQDTMTELSLEDGLELFCDRIKNNNNNLPTFNYLGGVGCDDDPKYDYDDICGETGELMKLDAKVYCTEKDLSYEDASGDYKVIAVAQDTNSLTGTLENSFEYLPLTAFEADFTHVSYGNVKLNINKIAKGDKTWGTADLPTVRNVGNTRMNLTVNQDDMGLGMSSGVWNVMFDARVGSYVSHQSYEPNVTTTLDDALDLSEMDEVDFSILVTKFPTGNTTTSWSGNITLGAVTAPHLICVD